MRDFIQVTEELEEGGARVTFVACQYIVEVRPQQKNPWDMGAVLFLYDGRQIYTRQSCEHVLRAIRARTRNPGLPNRDRKADAFGGCRGAAGAVAAEAQKAHLTTQRDQSRSAGRTA